MLGLAAAAPGFGPVGQPQKPAWMDKYDDDDSTDEVDLPQLG